MYMEDLTREDIKRYLLALHRLDVTNRTVANRIGYVQTFLLLQKCGELLTVKDKPKFTKRAPNAYNQSFLARLFAACDAEDQLAFQFFLGSGAREQEVMYACWPDIDFIHGTFRITEKADLGWTLKDYEERTIPLPTDLLNALTTRRKERPKDRFLFPTKAGKPEGHFLRRLKRVALRAGLNCGHCRSKKSLSCRTHPVCGHVELHRFRRTFATLHHEAGRAIKKLQTWLGHSDIETTLQYLANSEDQTSEIRDAVDRVFRSVHAPTVDASRCVANL